MITALLIAAALATAETEVAVDAGEMTPELVRLLRFERPDLSFTSSTSTVATRVSLRRDRELLSLAVIENGSPTIERVITVERERLKPALRTAALLVVEALAPEAGSLGEPDAPALLILRTGAGADLWLDPTTPRPVIAAALHVRFDQATAGLRFSFSYGGAENGVLDGTILDVGVLADGSYALTELGANRLFLIGGLGINVARFTGVARFGPGAESPSMSRDPTVEGAARIGFALETEPLIASMRLSIALGAKLRIGRMIVQLPEAVREGKDPLDPGIFSPFLEISTVFDVF